VSKSNQYDALVAEIEGDYQRLKNLPDQKSFALQAVKTKCPAALFQLRKGTTPSVRDFLADLFIKSVLGLLQIGDDEIEVPTSPQS